MRIRIVKKHHHYRVGEVVEVSKNEAFGLLDSGVGVVSKEMTQADYKTKALDEVQANGNPTQLRTNRPSKR